MNEIYLYCNKNTVYVVDMAISISPFVEVIFYLPNSLVVVITAS